ncbi:MAG: hypothetical protein WBH45_00705 [Acidobacteriaceae bacterium]
MACGRRIETGRVTVNSKAISMWPGQFAFANSTQVCAWLSRLLLALAAIELVTMPLTQHLWTWDRFFHGGQDFELGLFVIVSCLCLVLLRAQHCRLGIRFLLALQRFFRIPRLCDVFPNPLWAGGLTVASPDRQNHRSSGAFLTRLRI